MDETSEILKEKFSRRRDFLKLSALAWFGSSSLASCIQKSIIEPQQSETDLNEEQIAELIRNSYKDKGKEKLDKIVREVSAEQHLDMELWKNLPPLLLANSVKIEASKDAGASNGSGIIIYHDYSPQVTSEVALILTARHVFLDNLGGALDLRITRPHLQTFRDNPMICDFGESNFSYFSSPEPHDMGLIVVHKPNFHDIYPHPVKFQDYRQGERIKSLSFPGAAPLGLVSSAVLGDPLSVKDNEHLIKLRTGLFAPGSSGGPILGDNNTILGVVSTAAIGGKLVGKISDEDLGYVFMQPSTKELLKRAINGEGATGTPVDRMYKMDINVDEVFYPPTE